MRMALCCCVESAVFERRRRCGGSAAIWWTATMRDGSSSGSRACRWRRDARSRAQDVHQAIHIQRLSEDMAGAGASRLVEQFRTTPGDHAGLARDAVGANLVEQARAATVRQHQVEQDPI